MNNEKSFPYTWHEAIEILRNDPKYKDLIFNSYLSRDLLDNAERFKLSDEFQEVLNIIKKFGIKGKKVMDMPGGNGIATYAFASNGYDVTVVEPDDSYDVGRGAIEFILKQSKLKANIINAYGEKLPFKDDSFDIVYVRQGLHHANNLKMMLQEVSRVLAPSGILIATREHVVDNYTDSLEKFLNSQADHLLYGGENAFILQDYILAIKESGLLLKDVIKPYDSIINLFPLTFENLHIKILNSFSGKILSLFLPKKYIIDIALWYLNRKKIPGRLYSFIAQKKKLEY